MKKRINFRKLGRTPSHKLAMLRNLATSLIEHERVVTTLPKAKEVQSLAEKLITTAKKPDKVHARRQANKIVRTAQAQTKLMEVLGPRYQYRQGGYTRILKLAQPRAGDKADMAVIEYVDRPGEIRAARPPIPSLSLFSAEDNEKATQSLEDVFRSLGLEPPPHMATPVEALENNEEEVQEEEAIVKGHAVKSEEEEKEEESIKKKE